MSKYFLLGLLVFYLPVNVVLATDGCGGGPCANCHSLTLMEANELLRGVGNVKKVQASPVKGLWLLELERDGRRAVAFMDYGKKNIIAGTVFPLETGKTARPPVSAKHDGELIDLTTLPVESSIVLGNPHGARKLFVFTDPDCAYCRKMHAELKKLEKNTPDVAIHVMLYPLQVHPQAYDKSRIILSEKSRELLERAFEGQEVPQPIGNEGSEAVDSIISFADKNGISGTPTLVFPNGRIRIGIMDADGMKKKLEEK